MGVKKRDEKNENDIIRMFYCRSFPFFLSPYRWIQYIKSIIREIKEVIIDDRNTNHGW